jgi:MFS superfamily sulfate permease-like transporter/carbonic anhydrase/acetyltransferase-like protein (isoleucine patch superfamily)
VDPVRLLPFFLNPVDGRYEDLKKGSIGLNVLRDFTAGLIVAMVAIPLAMGFAMASGLRPEQGIVGGAIAGLVGALFGGSKYQVYGPTAAFIPVIAALMAAYDHEFLVLVSIASGLVLMTLGLSRLGRYAAHVPHSIVVGFTIGIAITIATSQLGEIFGIRAPLGYRFLDKVAGVIEHAHDANLWALVTALGTVVLTKGILRLSIFIPGPLIAIGIGTLLTSTVLAGKGLTIVRAKYGEIPEKSWIFTPPTTGPFTSEMLFDAAYFAVAIVFVSAIESLPCSRMADRLAGNKGTPYHPDKELWGQGLVQIVVPLVNGFPHTGALARTATNIKLGAISPLAGIFKCILKLALAFELAHYLELVPMACIGGILLYVAMNRVKGEEVKEALAMGKGHTLLMVYTAAAVVVFDFLTGVLTGLLLNWLFRPIDMIEARKRPPLRLPILTSPPVYLHAAAHGHARAAEDALVEGDGRAAKDDGAAKEAHAAAPSIRPAVAEKKVRGVIGSDRALARAPGHARPVDSERRRWLGHIRLRPTVPRSAFVHEHATLIGRVVLGDHVHIAAGSSVRADEGSPFFVGPGSNIQDGVILHALKHRYVRVAGEEWAIYVGRDCSLAHGCLVHGPCFVGDGTFIGFKAVVHDAVVGARCFIGIGAIVVGVDVPPGRLVPHCALVDTQGKADALPAASDAHLEFNEDVVEVNRGLASAYRTATAEERLVLAPTDAQARRPALALALPEGDAEGGGGGAGRPCSCGVALPGEGRRAGALAAAGWEPVAAAGWDRI